MKPSKLLKMAGAAAFVILLPVFALWAGPASAEHGDDARGRDFAVQACARCHVVADGVGSGTDGAPPFRSLPNDLKRTEPQLRAFLSRPHGQMPDLTLSRQEIADLVAYIMSLRTRR